MRTGELSVSVCPDSPNEGERKGGTGWGSFLCQQKGMIRAAAGNRAYVSVSEGLSSFYPHFFVNVSSCRHPSSSRLFSLHSLVPT